jgi:ketosteroid isomerase-like protein
MRGPKSSWSRDPARGDVTGDVKTVRDAAVAFNRGDLDTRSECFADDIDYRAIEGAPDDQGPIHDKDARRVYVQDWLDTFDDFRSEPVELIDAGEEQVIAVTRISGRAKLSGVETDLTTSPSAPSETGRSCGAASTGAATRPSRSPRCGSSAFFGHLTTGRPTFRNFRQPCGLGLQGGDS